MNPLLYTYLNSGLRHKISGWLAQQPLVGNFFKEIHVSAATDLTLKGHSHSTPSRKVDPLPMKARNAI